MSSQEKNPPDKVDPLERCKNKKVADRYQCRQKIGSGGMGVVYLAQDTLLNRQVVLKMLLPTLKVEKATTRFFREARILSRLNHPHIVTIYDFGTWEESMFIVLEYLEGQSLQQVIQERAPLTTPWILNALYQILDALEAAHQAGIIHRDLKPPNIFCLPQPDQPDYIKILDFGTAVSLEHDVYERITTHGEVIGTPHYMSPEQIMGKEDISPGVDIYSLGIILYEMLTGVLPFSGERTMSILLGHLYKTPEPFADQMAENDPQRKSLQEVVNICLNKNPQDRYASIPELRKALAEPPSSPDYRREKLAGDRSRRARQFYHGPVEITRHENQTLSSSATIPLQRPRLLVVEADDLPVEQSITPLLRLANYAVESFIIMDPKILKEVKPADMVILNKGREENLDLVHEIQAQKEWRTIPCLICGPEGDLDYISKVIEAGAADYLSYPFDPKEVTQKIDRLSTKDVI